MIETEMCQSCLELIHCVKNHFYQALILYKKVHCSGVVLNGFLEKGILNVNHLKLIPCVKVVRN